jgi:hypothetical protein
MEGAKNFTEGFDHAAVLAHLDPRRAPRLSSSAAPLPGDGYLQYVKALEGVLPPTQLVTLSQLTTALF